LTQTEASGLTGAAQWTAQTLALLFVVPLVVLAGQPVELARRRAGDRGLVDRVLRSRFGRVLANPLVGPTVIPVLSVVLFFGPLPGWAVGVAPVGWVLQLVVVGIGALIAFPLVGLDADEVALAVGLALIIGMVELIVDAIPGIVLRLQTHVATTFFAHRAVHPWSPRPLHDQQIAGATLWCVAEIIDLPFLVLMFRRWLRADRREALAADAVLDAERLVRGIVPRQPTTRSGEGAVDAPWWLTDPALRDRFRG
jgi:cytochrome c oxidase assembly factor CtaG